MKKTYFLIVIAFFAFTDIASAQEEEHHSPAEHHSIKRHRVGIFLGNALIHGVKNSQTGKEQYVLAPTVGLDYTYFLSHKWAIGTYNELNHVDIEVETDSHEEFIKRENTMLFSGVVVFEPVRNLGIFAGTGFETDPHETLWIRYLGLEYTFINCDDWHVSLTTGFINKDKYNAFNFGVVVSRGFGKTL
jgi:hypothetical protein